MSLVDYASSDEDESEVREEEEVEERGSLQAPKRKSESPKHHPLPPQRQTSRLSSNEHLGSSHLSEPSVVKLPDASVLLNSTHVSSHLVSGGDHSFRVAAAMAEHESRKREPNGLTSALPRSKIPRGNMPHSRVGGLLVPPQLKGRSNVVTEDISKLFVRKNADPSSRS
ncbi:Kinesin-like protein [Actinidia chinensis var. chinensis]|uniref:Kinesin-like protein n=1 Tax=Actinidia chinensis var. chinensis TaxID=1590841 RepID=A0A2R6QKM8_ACTCC|nr:Kinesin-like protein [Actinidia chinensis var. chinensis]